MSITCPSAHGEHAGVARQQQAIRFVEVDRRFQLRQRPGHDVADLDLVGIAVDRAGCGRA